MLHFLILEFVIWVDDCSERIELLLMLKVHLLK